MPLKNEKELLELVDSIKERLDSLEDLTMFVARANLRFRKGQRVRFNAIAERRGITRGRRTLRGRIVEADNSFTVKVLLDGHKHPQEFHHAFFERTGRAAGGKA